MQLYGNLFPALALSMVLSPAIAFGVEQNPTTQAGSSNIEAQQPATDVESNIPTPTDRVGKAPQPRQSQAQISDVLEQQGILTPRGMLVLEPQFQYVNSSVTQVNLEGYTILPALLVGSINIDSVRNDTVTWSLGMRYGITSHFELEARLPFVRSDEQISSRPLNQGTQENTVTKAWGQGLGDVEMAVHYQFNDGENGWPYFIGNLRVKSDTGRGPFQVPVTPSGLQLELPTGTGFWGIQPSITFTMPSDPAVFYGSLSYLWNLERKVNIAGRPTISPGNSVGASLGMGLALNENASFSLGYSHNTVSPAQQNGQTITGSKRLQVGVLLIGVSYRVKQRTTVNFNLGVGVTQDAPNVQVTLSLPLSFTPRG